jgi:hypothetical protein
MARDRAHGRARRYSRGRQERSSLGDRSDVAADHQTWKVTGGVDLDGDDLVCAVGLEDDVIVVTIF